MELSGQLDDPAALPPGKNPVPIEYGVGWAPEPVWPFWIRETSLVSLWIGTPDRPARSLITASPA